MAEEQADANVVSEESSESDNQEQEINTSEDTQSLVESPEDQMIPKSRLDEVISQRNELRERMDDIESRLTKKEEAETASTLDIAVQRLVAGGMDEESASLLVDSQMEVARGLLDERVQPIETQAQNAKVDKWVNELEEQYKDYKDLQPKMLDAFKELSIEEQGLVTKTKRGLKMLYSQVKLDAEEGTESKQRQDGISEGYKARKAKEAFSSTRGGQTAFEGSLPTPNDIQNMSLEDYQKNRSAILKSQAEIAKKRT